MRSTQKHSVEPEPPYPNNLAAVEVLDIDIDTEGQGHNTHCEVFCGNCELPNYEKRPVKHI